MKLFIFFILYNTNNNLTLVTICEKKKDRNSVNTSWTLDTIAI